MVTPADYYSTTELAVALKAALRAVDALDGTGLDVVTRWQEEAEAMADTIATELRSREVEGEEAAERLRALAAYSLKLACHRLNWFDRSKQLLLRFSRGLAEIKA